MTDSDEHVSTSMSRKCEITKHNESGKASYNYFHQSKNYVTLPDMYLQKTNNSEKVNIVT